MTVLQLLESYDKGYLPVVISAARIRSSIKHLSIQMGRIEVESLDEALLIAYREKRKAEDAAPGTINREIGTLSSALRYHKIVPGFNFPYEREIPRVARLTEEEIQRLIDNSPNLQCRAFIALLLATGQRKDAVLKLRYSQIRGSVIEFEADGYEKAYRRKRRARTPLTASIRGILAKLREAFGETEYILPAGVGKDKPCSMMSRWFQLAAEGARVMATPHSIRHSACNLAIEKGATLEQASRFLGHSSVATTEKVYFSENPSYIESTVSKLGGLVKI